MPPPLFTSGGGENLKKEEFMKRNLFNIGIGGFGSRLSSEVTRKMKGNGLAVTSFAVDTDLEDIKEISCDYKLNMFVPERLCDTLERLESEKVRIFSEDTRELGYVKNLPMDKGANSWRMKAMVSFISYMNDEENKKKFDDYLDSFSFNADDSYVFNVFTSLAGGTGSALFIPLTLYIKRFLKEKGCRKVEFTLYCACPDIFVEGLNRELKAKAYANAYASLSELHTINCVALRKNQSKIKIGYENSSVGVLFDGGNSEYYNKERMPFGEVYIFDRMPGLFSTDIHLSILADYAYYVMSGYSAETPVKNCAIIKSYTASQINLDTEDIIDYIAKYGVENSINNELFTPFFQLERSETLPTDSKYNGGRRDEVGEYSNKIIRFVENLSVSSKEKTTCLLGRLDEENHPLIIDNDDWLLSYRKKIFNAIGKRFENDEYKEIVSSLVKSKDKKKSKRKALADLLDKIKVLNEKLDEYYAFTEETVEKENFKDFLLGDDLNTSLVENVLKEDGKYIHPTLALVRLCKIYVEFIEQKEMSANVNKKKNNAKEKGKGIPDELLLLVNHVTDSFGYGALGKDRFLRVIAKREDKTNVNDLSSKEKRAYLRRKKRYVLSNANAEGTIYFDYREVLQNIVYDKESYYFEKFAELVGGLIEEYQNTVKELSLIKYQIKEEVSSSKKERVSQGVYYGVATSEEEREKSLTEYCDEIRPLGHFDADNDLGRRVFEYSLNNIGKEKTDSLKPITKLFELFVSDAKERIKKTDFYEKLEGENVFSKILEPIRKSYEDSYVRKAMMISSNLLTVNKVKEKETKILFISKNTAEHVLSLKDKLNLRAETAIDAVDELIVDMGEYNAYIKIVDEMSDKKAYVICEKSGITVPSLSKMNGDKDLCIYKDEYEKAMEKVVSLDTPMWNPHIFDIKSGIDLVVIK